MDIFTNLDQYKDLEKRDTKRKSEDEGLIISLKPPAKWERTCKVQIKFDPDAITYSEFEIMLIKSKALETFLLPFLDHFDRLMLSLCCKFLHKKLCPSVIKYLSIVGLNKGYFYNFGKIGNQDLVDVDIWKHSKSLGKLKNPTATRKLIFYSKAYSPRDFECQLQILEEWLGGSESSFQWKCCKILQNSATVGNSQLFLHYFKQIPKLTKKFLHFGHTNTLNESYPKNLASCLTKCVMITDKSSLPILGHLYNSRDFIKSYFHNECLHCDRSVYSTFESTLKTNLVCKLLSDALISNPYCESYSLRDIFGDIDILTLFDGVESKSDEAKEIIIKSLCTDRLLTNALAFLKLLETKYGLISNCWTDNLIFDIISTGNIEIFKWVHSLDFEKSNRKQKIFKATLQRTSTSAFTLYLISIDYLSPDEICKIFNKIDIEPQHQEIIKIWIDKCYPIDSPFLWKLAFFSNNTDYLDFLKSHKCPALTLKQIWEFLFIDANCDYNFGNFSEQILDWVLKYFGWDQNIKFNFDFTLGVNNNKTIFLWCCKNKLFILNNFLCSSIENDKVNCLKWTYESKLDGCDYKLLSETAIKHKSLTCSLFLLSIASYNF